MGIMRNLGSGVFGTGWPFFQLYGSRVKPAKPFDAPELGLVKAQKKLFPASRENVCTVL
jgi:hypothetical protein